MTSIIDSLPYYDNDLELYPNLKAKVEKELAREPKAPQELHEKVPPAIELFTVSMERQPLYLSDLCVEKSSASC